MSFRWTHSPFSGLFLGAGVILFTPSPSFAQQKTGSQTPVKASAARVPARKPAPASLTSTGAKPGPKIKMDFRDVPINQILRYFSVASGLTLIKDPSVQGRATLISPRPLPLADAWAVLDAWLDSRGYRLDRTDLMVRVVPKGGGGNRGNRSSRGAARPGTPASRPTPEQTKVYRLEYASAKSLSSIINNLFKNVKRPKPRTSNNGKNKNTPAPTPIPSARASADDYSNSVVVTGPPAEIKQVDQIVQQIDNPVGSMQMTQVYPVKYVAVQDLANVVGSVLVASETGGAGGGAASHIPSNRRSRALMRGSTVATSGQVVPHIETNSLIVTASKESQGLIRQVIDEIDQPQEVKSTTFVRNLRNVSASDVSLLLAQIYGQRAGVRGSYSNYRYNSQGRNSNNRNGRTSSRGNRGRRG